MPIVFIIDSKERLILTTITGVLSVPEMRTYYAELAAHPGFCAEYSSLTDFSGAAPFDVSGDDVRQLARTIPMARGSRRAIVVGSDLHYGLGRMVSFTRSPDLEIEVFRSRAEALTWLGVPDYDNTM